LVLMVGMQVLLRGKKTVAVVTPGFIVDGRLDACQVLT
jgi:hypothetical protein